jgi:tetratricopeptide (TPR) repeat protein
VSFVSRRKPYDRVRILKEADQARTAKRWRRAISLYRRVLAAEPRNPELHFRIAPLLARTGDRFDARQAFERAAQASRDTGSTDREIAVYRDAIKHFPHDYSIWRSLADAELREQRPSRAREILLEGRRRMRGRRRRAEAIALLRAALEIEPGDVDTAIDLASQLARMRQQPEARLLLSRATEVAEGRALRRVAGLAWRLDPSVRHTFAWLRAAWRARGERRVRVSPRAKMASQRS